MLSDSLREQILKGRVSIKGNTKPLSVVLLHFRAPQTVKTISSKNRNQHEEEQTNEDGQHTYEPARDKTNKWHVRLTKTQISLGIRPG